MSTYRPGSGLPLAIPLGSTTDHASAQVTDGSTALGGTNTPATLYPELTGKRRHRINADVLRRIADVIPARDYEVLGLIGRHRFLTTHHVRAFVFNNHGTPDSAARSARLVLQRLARTALIQSLAQRIGGARAGSSARVWQLTPAGARLLRDTDTAYRPSQPSTRFLAHCLAIADVHLSLRRVATLPQVERADVFLEPETWRRYSGPAGECRVLQPDLAANIETKDFTDRWFIEVDLGTESIPTLLRKCLQYEAYRAAGIEQHQHGSFPLVLWMFSKPVRVAQLAEAVAHSSRFTQALYRFSTAEAFYEVVTEPLS